MGAQKMGSQGGGGIQEPTKSHSLTREASLYSLTLDEVQSHIGNLGKPLSSMNLDELMTTVWTVEGSHGPGQHTENSTAQNLAQVTSNPTLASEGSLTLSRDRSKTIDELWKEIQSELTKKNQQKSMQGMHPSLGEITLEDFLAKAGVVAESPQTKKTDGPEMQADSQNNAPQAAQWMPYQLSEQQPQQQNQGSMISGLIPSQSVQHSIPISMAPIMDSAYDMQITVATSPLRGALSDTQTPGRKRVAPGDVVEKSVERRQKRMIKNRESAARSRARKQAYTHELENKISELEEENERLKKQKEVEKSMPSMPPPEPKHQLRRTSSASF